MDDDSPAASIPDVPAVEVPPVVGFDAADACEMVRTAGLVPYGPDHTDAPTIGVVLAQTPPAGTEATIGAAVLLHTEPGNLAAD